MPKLRAKDVVRGIGGSGKSCRPPTQSRRDQATRGPVIAMRRLLFLVVALALSACAASPPSDPFLVIGPAVPPSFVMTAALAPAAVHDANRPRAAHDARGFDCNDYAWDRRAALRAQGQDARLVAAVDELGELHMLVESGPLFWDSRLSPPDRPLSWDKLEQLGYSPVSREGTTLALWQRILTRF
jgi:hypothetical protein